MRMHDARSHRMCVGIRFLVRGTPLITGGGDHVLCATRSTPLHISHSVRQYFLLYFLSSYILAFINFVPHTPADRRVPEFHRHITPTGRVIPFYPRLLLLFLREREPHAINRVHPPIFMLLILF